MSEAIKPKLIVHIGMGKTGTTSIQRALRISTKELDSKGVKYLGMWFEFERDSFVGTKETVKFFKLDEDALHEYAREYANLLYKYADEDNKHKFVISNEQFFANFSCILPFFRELSKTVDLEVLCFVRSPEHWLPSAYAQWGVVNKTYSGFVKSFDNFGADLLMRYKMIEKWADAFQENFKIVQISEAENSISVFESLADLRLLNINRSNVRLEPEDILLRAIFNNAQTTPSNQKYFDRVIFGENGKMFSSVDAIQRCISTESIGSLIDSHSELFSRLNSRFSMDLTAIELTKDGLKSAVNSKKLQSKMIEIILNCCERIFVLEEEVKSMRKQ